MRLMKAAFMALIALDLIIMLFAVFLLTPLWILVSIIISAVLKGIHNHLRIKQKISQFYKINNRIKSDGYRLSS